MSWDELLQTAVAAVLSGAVIAQIIRTYLDKRVQHSFDKQVRMFQESIDIRLKSFQEDIDTRLKKVQHHFDVALKEREVHLQLESQLRIKDYELERADRSRIEQGYTELTASIRRVNRICRDGLEAESEPDPAYFNRFLAEVSDLQDRLYGLERPLQDDRLYEKIHEYKIGMSKACDRLRKAYQLQTSDSDNGAGDAQNAKDRAREWLAVGDDLPGRINAAIRASAEVRERRTN